MTIKIKKISKEKLETCGWECEPNNQQSQLVKRDTREVEYYE